MTGSAPLCSRLAGWLDRGPVVAKQVSLAAEGIFSQALTAGIPVEQEGVLQLEVQVLGDGLGEVLHAQAVHDGEAVSGRGQPERTRRTF